MLGRGGQKQHKKSKDSYSTSLAHFRPWCGHMKQQLQAENLSLPANSQLHVDAEIWCTPLCKGNMVPLIESSARVHMWVVTGQ